MPGVNYTVMFAPLREQLQELNTGRKTLLQLLLKIEC